MGDKKIMKSQLTETKNDNDQKDYNLKVLAKENEELRAQNSDLRDEVVIIRNRFSLLEERAKKQINELKTELHKLQRQVILSSFVEGVLITLAGNFRVKCMKIYSKRKN